MDGKGSMNRPNEPGKWNLRTEMPETAKWVDARRAEWGAPYVNDCIRRALGTEAKGGAPAVPGEPGLFYAIEGGNVLGTPFPATEPMAHWQRYAIVCGVRFAVFMATPTGGMTHGTD